MKAVTVISPLDSTNPLVMTTDFCVSKYGQGCYRIDGANSYGKLNCIFFLFEPASKPEVTEKEVKWTESVLESEGKKILRKEALLLNPLPRKENPLAAILRIRVDAANKELLSSLSQRAEEILKNSIQPVPDNIPREMY